MADTSSAHGYGALYIDKETTFSDATTPATYVEVIKWTDSRDKAYFENDVVKQGLQQHTPGVVGHKSDSTAELEMYMHGYSEAEVTVGPGALVHPDADLVACALGGIVADGYDGTGTKAACTTSLLKGTNTTSFKSGQAVLVDGQVGWVKKNTAGATNELELDHVLEWAPVAGKPIYGSITCWPTDTFDATMSPSLAAKWLGLRVDDVTTYRGMRPNSLKITGAPKDFLRMSLGFNMADWERTDTGGDPDLETYDYPAREEIIGARLLLQESTGKIGRAHV